MELTLIMLIICIAIAYGASAVFIFKARASAALRSSRRERLTRSGVLRQKLNQDATAGASSSLPRLSFVRTLRVYRLLTTLGTRVSRLLPRSQPAIDITETLSGRAWWTSQRIQHAITDIPAIALSLALTVFVIACWSSVVRAVLLGILTFFLVIKGWEYYVGQAAKSRRKRFEHEIPRMLSMLVLAIQAGSSLDAALTSYTESFTTPLSGVLSHMQESYQSGVMSRDAAFEQASEELDSPLFDRFSITMRRALRLGTPLSGALAQQMDDIAAYRKERIEEEIAKKPIQLLIPLGLFILPAMLILLLGPVLMEVLAGLTNQG